MTVPPKKEGVVPINGTSLNASGIHKNGGADLAQKFEHTESDLFPVTKEELSKLAGERNRETLAALLEKGLLRSSKSTSREDTLKLVHRLHELEQNGGPAEHSAEEAEQNKNAEIAAAEITSLLLNSSPENGISVSEVERRQEWFGSNAIADKELSSFLRLCWEASQDYVLVFLIILGVITVIVEPLGKGDDCGLCWLEGTALLVTVMFVILITAGIDYAKQFAFIRLTRSLLDTNTKSVIRDGQQVTIIDDEIVVGDILSVNSHNLASIPADCMVLGPDGGLQMDEAALTGESHLVRKYPGDVVLSGTTAMSGSGKLVVIAVGINSVAGKIKARVYESGDEVELDSDEDSPLTAKLNIIATRIGMLGATAALLAFAASCIIGLAVNGQPVSEILGYVVVSITVLAVAVPEGLPLAVTLALAFSSGKMMKEQNLVKQLDACETMGSATTICTDKTGTLTANKMTARALFVAMESYLVEDPAVSLADFAKAKGLLDGVIDLFVILVSVNTMNETVLYLDDNGNIEGSTGNPTEVALLTLVHDLGYDYSKIRDSTRGRSNQGPLAEFAGEGKLYEFSSARKMMSYAVPTEGGGFRLYTKGAPEVLLTRCSKVLMPDGSIATLTESQKVDFQEDFQTTAVTYARRGMRNLGFGYRDLPAGFDLEKITTAIKNSDGTDAFEAETDLIAVGMVGIEDPLRKEVPGAIQKCYEAGIDVRMVTGDNPNTAVSIAYQAGILRDDHFVMKSGEKVASNLKDNVMLEGRVFRQKIFTESATGEREFNQEAFDEIWPYLRVLARSSPDDKLALAHGLNQSNLYADKDRCRQLVEEHSIVIFPDRQVVAMTGDGTNDSPALKRADIGFAMGIAGTQIAKDAADIILLDDNFASIVTAAKWGRNIYASIQKFLQFQLTVNIAAVTTALVGAFSYQTTPLAAIQLLWVNLIMDSFASLALASEPPVDELLQKPPVNRTESMITKHMWANMLGQAAYQIIVVQTIFFTGPTWLDIEPGHSADDNSVHYTLIFNTFVWMQLFNEINARKLKGEFNVFAGLHKNPLFYGILLGTAALQVLIVQFGSVAFSVVQGGLDGKFWGISMAFGAGSLPVQQVINLLYRLGQMCKGGSSSRGRRGYYAGSPQPDV